MLVANQFHITYCTNIHPGETWQVTFDSLQSYVIEVRKKVAEHEPFGIGLRLSNIASEQLGQKNELTVFKDWLERNNLYIVTMNGFPYGNFHKETVKDFVHQPDWTTQDRVVYTKRMFSQLSYLLAAKGSAGISTSPVSYKRWYTTQEQKEKVLEKGARHMVDVAFYLYELEKSTGKYLHLDIEPEPDGMLENTKDFIVFFQEYLIPSGIVAFSEKYEYPEQKIKELIRRYITLCYDVCHFALAFEEPQDTFEKLAKTGIKTGKIQVSSALKVSFNKSKKKEIISNLRRFDEDIYLHQVTALNNINEIKTFRDLSAFFESSEIYNEARVHFHVPIFTEHYGLLTSTQDQILKTIAYLKSNPVTTCLEIETYTWDVLPKDLKINLAESISREMNWLKNKL